MPPQMSRRLTHIVWLRNDLRLHDNALFASSLEMLQRMRGGQGGDASRASSVLPVYCFDPRQFAPSRYGARRKTGIHRARFLVESVLDLREQLRALGSDLLVSFAKPEICIPAVAEALGGGTEIKVLCQREVCSEEIRVSSAVERALAPMAVDLEQHWGSTLHHIDDLPFDIAQLPHPFTAFRNRVEKDKQPRTPPRAPLPNPLDAGAGSLPLPAADALASARAVAEGEDEASGPGNATTAASPPQPPHTTPADDTSPSPQVAGAEVHDLLLKLGFSAREVADTASPDARAALHCQGGERVALDRLQHYLWDTDSVASYFDTRNGLVGADYSTKFAPWLAVGALSPRQIFAELTRYERERQKNKSTYWVVFELLWRDYFRFYGLCHGNAIFLPGGTKHGKHAPDWAADPGDVAFNRWATGHTGVPFVDANMRELQATGFMSNRGRQNVASFLCHDLRLDWRKGADLFENLLTDYDPCSNWGNWMFAAGLAGGRINRFNMAKQASDYDPEGTFVRQWVPELAKVPRAYVHSPWRLSADERRQAGCEEYTSQQPLGGGGGGGRGAYSGGGGGGRGGAQRAPKKRVTNGKASRKQGRAHKSGSRIHGAAWG